MPLIILAAAALVGWWASQKEMRRMSDIRSFVLLLVQPGAEGDPDTGALSAAEPLLPPGLGGSLRMLRSDLLANNQSAVVDVRPGDTDRYGDGTATHTAVIMVEGRARLGLRIVHQNNGRTLLDKVRVIGYFLPDEGPEARRLTGNHAVT